MLPRRKAALTSRMEVRVVKSMVGRARNLASACNTENNLFELQQSNVLLGFQLNEVLCASLR